jgi:hypothetical protein
MCRRHGQPDLSLSICWNSIFGGAYGRFGKQGNKTARAGGELSAHCQLFSSKVLECAGLISTRKRDFPDMQFTLTATIRIISIFLVIMRFPTVHPDGDMPRTITGLPELRRMPPYWALVIVPVERLETICVPSVSNEVE